jgi:hypothetical protein
MAAFTFPDRLGKGVCIRIPDDRSLREYIEGERLKLLVVFAQCRDASPAPLTIPVRRDRHPVAPLDGRRDGLMHGSNGDKT